MNPSTTFCGPHNPERGAAERGAARWPPRGPIRVLLVLDDEHLVETVRRTFDRGGYDFRSVTTEADVRTNLTDWQPHLGVLDLAVDVRHMMQLISTRPVGGRRLPVIALNRSGDFDTLLVAFDLGVDDVLTVPFADAEFRARMIALLSRSYSDTVTFSPVIRVAELEIDILTRSVRLGTSQLRLTPLEESVLYLLAANAGRVVTRDEILDTLWGVDYVPESNVVDSQIRSLRTKLKDTWRRPRFIATISGRGYQFLSDA
jgi:two-component system OmpR family response regulator